MSLLVTTELLLKLFDHTVELRIWDSKDKVSARARFDRPKAFRLPIEENADNATNNVKALVVKQSLSFMELQPRESRDFTGNKPRHCENVVNKIMKFSINTSYKF